MHAAWFSRRMMLRTRLLGADPALCAHFRAQGVPRHPMTPTRLHQAALVTSASMTELPGRPAPASQLTPGFLCVLTSPRHVLAVPTLIYVDGNPFRARDDKGIRRNGAAKSESWGAEDPGRINGFQNASPRCSASHLGTPASGTVPDVWSSA